MEYQQPGPGDTAITISRLPEYTGLVVTVTSEPTWFEKGELTPPGKLNGKTGQGEVHMTGYYSRYEHPESDTDYWVMTNRLIKKPPETEHLQKAAEQSLEATR